MQKEDIVHIFKRKKLQLFFLFYVLLALPLLSPLAQNIPIENIFCILGINMVLFFAIYVFALFLTPRGEKVLYTVLFVLSIIPGAMFLGYLISARVLLEQNSITSLFETNPEESKEFVMHYLNVWVVIGVIVYVIIPIIMIWKMKSYRPLKIKHYKSVFIVSLLVILSVVCISRISKSIYFVNFYNTFASYKIRLYNEAKSIQERQSKDYKVEKREQLTFPQTIVVVVGESLTRHHMQLYGYGRKTNPLLMEKKDELYIYTNVISPQVHTIPVLRSVFSFSEKNNPEYLLTKPSLFELFNRADYETYFISNQPFGGNLGTSYDALLDLAHHKYDLSSMKSCDEVLLGKLKAIMSETATKDRFIVLHLAGNHMAYKFRYPPSFNVFDSEKDSFISLNKNIDKESRRSIDEYDNSVLYNDSVIAEIINILDAKKETKSVMIYFSDHGEELFDFRSFAGHAYEKVSSYMCEIPFIVWLSDDFRGGRSELMFNTNLPYSIEDFIYSVSDVAGLEYEDYDSSRSIFSPQFNPRKRYVGDIPYSELIEFKKIY